MNRIRDEFAPKSNVAKAGNASPPCVCRVGNNTYIYAHTHIYIYIEREREREIYYIYTYICRPSLARIAARRPREQHVCVEICLGELYVRANAFHYNIYT